MAENTGATLILIAAEEAPKTEYALARPQRKRQRPEQYSPEPDGPLEDDESVDSDWDQGTDEDEDDRSGDEGDYTYDSDEALEEDGDDLSEYCESEAEKVGAVFKEPAWWDPLRPLHGAMYLAFALLALSRVRPAGRIKSRDRTRPPTQPHQPTFLAGRPRHPDRRRPRAAAHRVRLDQPHALPERSGLAASGRGGRGGEVR
jgi:hypothetical protein